jgi:hypothetical protein
MHTNNATSRDMICTARTTCFTSMLVWVSTQYQQYLGLRHTRSTCAKLSVLETNQRKNDVMSSMAICAGTVAVAAVVDVLAAVVGSSEWLLRECNAVGEVDSASCGKFVRPVNSVDGGVVVVVALYCSCDVGGVMDVLDRKFGSDEYNGSEPPALVDGSGGVFAFGTCDLCTICVGIGVDGEGVMWCGVGDIDVDEVDAIGCTIGGKCVGGGGGGRVG